MDNAGSLDAHFREAVAAIDAGDVPELERLIAAHPALVQERLTSPGTQDSAWGGTPLGWAEHYLSEDQGKRRDRQYAEIAAYLRAHGRDAR